MLVRKDMNYLGILVIVGIVISAYKALKAEDQRRKAEGQPHTFRDDALLLLSGLVIVAVMTAGFAYPPLRVVFKSQLLGSAILGGLAGIMTYVFNRPRRNCSKRSRSLL